MKSRVFSSLIILFSILLFSCAPIESDALFPKSINRKEQDKEGKNKKLTSEKDWLYYAETAKNCINSNQNLHDALELIDHSIDLQINPINLEIKGDYYIKIGDLNNAFSQYKKAIELCVFNIKSRKKLEMLQQKAIATQKAIISKR